MATTNNKKESPDQSKVFDVAKPGEAAPPATGRPIITQHPGGMTQDPMVKQKETAVIKDADVEIAKLQEDESNDSVITEKKVIAPISDDMKNNASSDDTSTEVPEEENGDQTKTEDEPLNDGGDAGAVDALAQEVSSKKEASKAEAQAKKQREEIQKIIDSKKYVVPIGEEAHRKSGRRALMFLVVFLVIVVLAVNFGVDAELIDVGFEPFTDIL